MKKKMVLLHQKMVGVFDVVAMETNLKPLLQHYQLVHSLFNIQTLLISQNIICI